MSISRLASPVLDGALVRLEPLSAAHADDYRVAASGDRSSFGWTWVPTPEEVDGYIAGQLARVAAGTMSSYAQIELATGRAVGHTSYWEPRSRPDGTLSAVEVGHSWLAPTVQASGFNSESKLLLFANAFESWGLDRVDLKTDARNARSRAAIAAVGGSFEGVLRNWGFSSAEHDKGALRDSAMFSLIAEEWPQKKAALEARLARKTAAAS